MPNAAPQSGARRALDQEQLVLFYRDPQRRGGRRRRRGATGSLPPRLLDRAAGNLSPREFENRGVAARLKKLVTTCGAEPAKITLEITETHHIIDI